MKKIIVTVLALFALSFANAQDSKGYIGISLGAGFGGGDLDDMDLGTGFNLGLINAGYRFSENFGATLNWGATGFSVNDVDATIGVGYLAIGPMVSLPVGEKSSIDFKPQYAFTSAVIEVFGEKATETGSGFLLGASYNFSIANHWGLAVNLDYLSAKITEDGEDFKPTVVNTSLGIQYRF